MEKIKSRISALYTMLTITAVVTFGVLVTTFLVALGILMLILVQIISLISNI